MKMNRGLSRVVILSLLNGVLGLVFIAVCPAYAQTSASLTPIVSTSTVQVSTASAVAASTETVTFSGPVVVTATVVTDPTQGPTTLVVAIDGRGLKGIGTKTGIVYLNECEANLTRPFAGTDVIETTFAYFEDAPGSYLKAKTGLLTLNMTYNTTTKTLSKVTASVSTLVITSAGTP